jgi:hypothetical protein
MNPQKVAYHMIGGRRQGKLAFTVARLKEVGLPVTVINHELPAKLFEVEIRFQPQGSIAIHARNYVVAGVDSTDARKRFQDAFPRLTPLCSGIRIAEIPSGIILRSADS